MSLRQKLENQLDSMLVDMSKQRISYKKTPDFRTSSLPSCPIRNLLFDDRADSFSMDFYTSIGTAVHETAQKWLAVGGYQDKIFSCWRAKETGEIIGPCFKDEIPASWSNYTIEYEEITINYNGLSGHVDLVVEILPGMFMVVDFKTTDLSGKRSRYPYNWQKQYPASRSSIIQISTYSTLLRKLFKINIVAWCLVYVDRGKVIQTNKDFHKVMRRWTPSKHKHMLAMLDRACINDARFRKLDNILKTSKEYSPEAEKLLKQIVINRPCIDQETYDEWIDYKFYTGPGAKPEKGTKNGCCELKEFCLLGNKSAFKAVQRRL